MNQFIEWVLGLYTKPLLSFSVFDLFCLAIITLVVLGVIDGIMKAVKKAIGRNSQAGQPK